MKESLNMIWHHFHQYQQNEQSPLILTQLTEHKKENDIWHWKSRTFCINIRISDICYMKHTFYEIKSP